MAELLMFHHAQGLTGGVVSFADELRAAGHLVHTPDLSDGKTFTQHTDGVGYAKQIGGTWPHDVPLQMHMMDADEWVEEDIVVARHFAETIESAELFLYPGDRHLFTDNSLPDCDPSAATLVGQRVLSFLDNIE